MLRGKKPEAIEKRLKALFYGTAGVGKTTCAIQFPKPYLIDTEKGAENDQYIELLEKHDGCIFQTTDFDEVLQEVKTLLTIKHPYKTLIIDSATPIYNDKLDQSAKKVGTDFGRHYNEVNKSFKQLVNLLLKLDMNVIITCHAKNEYGQNLAVLGQKPDCYAKLEFLFDLVFEIQKRGPDRVGIVKKTRIKNFADNESFSFCYDTMAEKYGRDSLEREALARASATPEQINELKRLIEMFNITQETIDRWLDKGKAETLEDLEQEHILALVNHLKAKIVNEGL